MVVGVRHLFEWPDGGCAVIDRLEESCAQQLGELRGIYFVTLTAFFEQVVAAWVADDQLRDERAH